MTEQDAQEMAASVTPLYGVFCPGGACNQTHRNEVLAWHHADMANERCGCGGGFLSHVVRKMPARTCTAPPNASHFSRCDCLDCFTEAVTEMENERD